MDYTIPSPIGDVTFYFSLDTSQNVIGISSTNPAVVDLIGADGFAYNPAIALALAEGIAGAVAAQL